MAITVQYGIMNRSRLQERHVTGKIIFERDGFSAKTGAQSLFFCIFCIEALSLYARKACISVEALSPVAKMRL